MPKPFKFTFLLNLALERREESERAISQAMQGLARAKDRLSQIEQYRQEYRQRLNTSGEGGLSMHRFNDFRQFLSKLDQATEQQSADVARHEAMLDKCKADWMECSREVKAYETLAKRHQEREDKTANRLEQKQSDEWVSNMHRRRSDG